MGAALPLMPIKVAGSDFGRNAQPTARLKEINEQV